MHKRTQASEPEAGAAAEREASQLIQDRKQKVLSCQVALMKENFDLRVKERLYECISCEHIKGLATEQVRSMERRIRTVQDLLRTDIAYRERVDRIQAQLSDMIVVNSAG